MLWHSCPAIHTTYKSRHSDDSVELRMPEVFKIFKLFAACLAAAGFDGLALMEAVHGTAPDIAGKNLANPTALLFSGVMMLRHLQMNELADNIHSAALKVIGGEQL